MKTYSSSPHLYQAPVQSFNVFVYMWYWFSTRPAYVVFSVGLLAGLLLGMLVTVGAWVTTPQMAQVGTETQLVADDTISAPDAPVDQTLVASVPADELLGPLAYMEQAHASVAGQLPVADSAAVPTQVAASDADAATSDLTSDIQAVPAQKPVPPQLPLHTPLTITLRPGDTLTDMLTERGVANEAALLLASSIKNKFNPRQLRQGEMVEVVFDKWKNGPELTVKEMTLRASPDRKLIVHANPKGGFDSRVVEIPLRKELANIAISIRSSFLQAGQEAGIPNSVLMRLISAFSYDVDFQRDIHSGDQFQLLFERYYAEDGTFVRDGEVLYAALEQRGEKVEIYRYAYPDGSYDFFHPNGSSVRKGLLRTPVDGARISSGFGMRRHPILGYSKMHRGVDFAAPTGTPVFAAGDGTVAMAGVNGGYGNYVRVQHSSGYETAYAHLSRISVKNGARVKQGQIVGYVGSTGRSTGPHLHFEILANGAQVNPQNVKVLASQKLTGTHLAQFKKAREDVQHKLASIRREQQVASAQP